jgi:uncharacterized protein
MTVRSQPTVAPTVAAPRWLYIASAVIGAVAGLTGIGGGVYLSPLLSLSRWDTPKSIAATCAAFILVNSLVSWLVLSCYNGAAAPNVAMWSLPLAAALGGWLGARTSSKWLQQVHVRRITIGLLIFAAVRIIIKQL